MPAACPALPLVVLNRPLSMPEEYHIIFDLSSGNLKIILARVLDGGAGMRLRCANGQTPTDLQTLRPNVAGLPDQAPRLQVVQFAVVEHAPQTKTRGGPQADNAP